MKKTRKIGLIALSMVLPLLIVGCFALACTPPFNEFTDVPTRINLKNLTVWHIGRGNARFEKALDKMQQLGVMQVKNLEIQKFTSNDTSKSMEDLDESSLVIFDGDWISEQVNNPDVHRFLREASHKRAKLTAIGGLTSKFFETLDKAGVNEIGRDETGNVRNPAYSNPPLVGFKLKQASTPDGHSYFYPSIFTSNTENVDVMVQALINWLGE